jgi:hypothetical protein
LKPRITSPASIPALAAGIAEASVRDLAGRADLIGHVHRDVDRNRERHPLEPAGARENLRIDADDLAVQVEQRTAGVARIHRRVGLDERHDAVAGQ